MTARKQLLHQPQKGMVFVALYETNAAEIENLKSQMYKEAKDLKYYADLMRHRSAHGHSALLGQISNEEAGHLKRLQAEYFIMTGATHFPCVAMLDIPVNYLDALRERFIAENDGVKLYSDYATAVSNPRLSAVYTELSGDEQRHADKIAGLISEYISSI